MFTLRARVPNILGDFSDQVAETLGSRLSGLRTDQPGPYSRHVPVRDPDKMAALNAELEEKLLQIQELEGRSAGLEPATFRLVCRIGRIYAVL